MKKSIGLLLFAFLLAWGISLPNSSASAAATTGWKHINEHWYYYTAKGKATGWIQVNKKWYFFGSNGVMNTGWVKVNNKWYDLDSSGAMKTGWVKFSNKWYDLSTSGVMQTGWQTIAGKPYYFYPSGIMAASTTINGKVLGSDGTVKPAPMTPAQKAVHDAKAAGITAQLNSSGTYDLYKNGTKIGNFDSQTGSVSGDNSDTTLLETIALDLGFHANAAELKSLVETVQRGTITNYGVSDDGSSLTIFWDPKVAAATKQTTQALTLIQSAGAAVTPGADGSYNIFEGNVYVGYFSPDKNYPAVEGDTHITPLLKEIALALGWNTNAQQLDNIVNKVQSGTLINYSVTDDGSMLSIIWGPEITPAATTTKALADIQAAGLTAVLGADGTYNIFKDNNYVGYFNPDSSTHMVDGDGQYAALFVTVATDLGDTTTDLTNLVQKVMDGSATNSNISYDGTELSISW